MRAPSGIQAEGYLPGIPGVEVGVEVQDGEGLLVDGVEGAEGGQRNAVVAAEGDEFWVRHVFVEGRGTAGPELEEGFRHLREGESFVEGVDGDVGAVDDCLSRLSVSQSLRLDSISLSYIQPMTCKD